MKLGRQSNYHKGLAALVGAFSLIVKTDWLLAALVPTIQHTHLWSWAAAVNLITANITNI